MRDRTRLVVWQRLDTLGLEYCEIDFSPIRIEGTVTLVDAAGPCAVSYRVACDSSGATELAMIRLKREGERIERVITRTSGGAWAIDGTHVPAVDGLADLDLSVTPATNLLPLHRLRLAPGESASVTAAWIRFPVIDLVPLAQTYRRIDETHYEYESSSGFRASLTCDRDGIVQTYGSIWQRA
ncbi:MAG TPA: putative glycolipid-binding domain-containing protein [Kofleriaceae bacterium]